MNIISISAGLGNQMFQYALYVAMRSIHSDTLIDISEFKYRKHHHGYELDKIFNITADYATPKQVAAIADVKKDFWNCLRRDTLKWRYNTHGQVYQEQGMKYTPEIMDMRDTYFNGFWQSELYFKSVKDEVIQQLSWKLPLDNKNDDIAKHIKQCNSVSIHIRRGDYVKSRRWINVGSVCDINYYQRAIEYIKTKVDNPVFFIFSDDMEWVKQNLPLDNATYIDHNTGSNSYKDMQLMSMCRHNIIANSSFSWWGAYLNSNPEKIVLAPSIWFRNIKECDIIPQNWTTIEINYNI